MKKRVFALLTAIILIASIPSFAGAATKADIQPSTSVATEVVASNYKEAVLCKMIDTANEMIEKLVQTAQKTPYNDINLLHFAVSLVEAPVLFYARLIGANVVCEYETYFIDGVYVEIDPLRVISF